MKVVTTMYDTSRSSRPDVRENGCDGNGGDDRETMGWVTKDNKVLFFKLKIKFTKSFFPGFEMNVKVF